MTATHMVFDAGVAGEPHPGNFEVCKHLENIWWAQSARKILDEGLPADAVGLVFLPMWDWDFPLVNVGRKGRASDGGQVLFPVRRSYDADSIVVVTEDMLSHEVAHTSIGMGHQVTGGQIIRFAPAQRSTVRPRTQNCTVGETLGVIRVGRGTADELNAVLRNTISTADTDHLWLGVLPILARATKKIVIRNQHVFTLEANALGVKSKMLLDPIAVDEVVDDMIYGGEKERQQGKKAVSLKLIDSLLDPSKNKKVDPKRYISQFLQRESYRAVQRALGDPDQGPRIRAFAREEGLTDYGLIAQAYSDSTGKLVTSELVQKAMELSHSVHSNVCPIDALGDSI
ncbi:MULTISPECIES: hypothetical protein [Glutamicibacter]|uniref:hypothetical protein n=1 Tax=Glutamicibacter TaxID=1742989 RepID=UPI003FD4708E